MVLEGMWRTYMDVYTACSPKVVNNVAVNKVAATASVKRLCGK